MAKSIYNFFREKQTIDLINRLKEYGVNMVQESDEGLTSHTLWFSAQDSFQSLSLPFPV